MKTKIVVFDFDGVIVDSNYVKRNAWFEIFPESLGITDEEIEKILDLKGGETRFVILREVFKKKGIIEGEEMERLVNEYAEKFDEQVQSGIIFMPEVKETLPRLAAQAVLYVNSATPHESLRTLVKRLGIFHYFKDVLGNPGVKNDDSKKENLQLIIKLEKITAQEILFIGDHEIDHAAAQAIGCRFIGVPNEFNEWKEGVGFPLISNFSELPSMIF